MRSFAVYCLCSCLMLLGQHSQLLAEFRVGASIVDVTPDKLPVIVNGGMLSRSVDTVKTRLHARAIVIDDGRERIAVVVVDSCMMPRALLDQAKALAAQKAKIKPERMLISATHAHSAPSSLACLGTEADPDYVPLLRIKLAQAILDAERNLEPARVGWNVSNAAEYTALRRWIRRPDRIAEDPFGNPTVRANMHAGRIWDDVTGESGPEDPDLAMISFQSKDGRPLAVLANFSMHYFGDQSLSADYFGLFCEGLKQRLTTGQPTGKKPFVAIMSHGCSGDIYRVDYKQPTSTSPTIEEYTNGLLDIAVSGLGSIRYEDNVDLAMSETRMMLKYRVPDKQRLEWAQRIVSAMGDRLPKDQIEVYAREQVILHERQTTEVVVQGVRIGDIGIATTPNETYALTGLKLKHQSPLAKTMVIELANGGDGYIPPPEQHLLGGYNTWAARSAGLEVQAEPKIAEAALAQLEIVANQPRRVFDQGLGVNSQSISKAKPIAWWRLHEMSGSRAVDSSGNNLDGIFEPGVAFFLEGPRSSEIVGNSEVNRAVHFAGGRMETRLPSLKSEFSISMWFWNGMPLNARDTAGWMWSRGNNHGLGVESEHLGLGGLREAGKLVLQREVPGRAPEVHAGKTQIARWTWHQVVLVRNAQSVKVYLDGNRRAEIEVQSTLDSQWDAARFVRFYFGGRSDNHSNWEGRLDEIAVFDRALSVDEVYTLFPH